MSKAGPDLDADFWQQRYLSGQTGWDRGQASPALAAWARDAELPVSGARVLVPGCGRGHEVLELVARGYQVTAVDMAPAAIAALRQTLQAHGVSAELVQANLFDWQPDEPFDAIYEQTCLCAIEPAQWGCYADALWRWLRPGGSLFALFMQSEREGGPPFHCGLAQMRQLFVAERWAWIPGQVSVPHPTGLFEIAVRLLRRPQRT